MRLSYVAPLGGQHTERWTRYFAERGHAVQLLHPRIIPRSGEGGTAPDGVERRVYRSFRFRRAGLDYVLNGAAILPRALCFRNQFRRFRTDLVHAHYVDDAAFAAALSGFHPLVVTAWGSDILKRSRRLDGAVGWVLRRADLVTCDAEHMRSALVERGADPDRVRIVGFGTDTGTFRPRPPDPATVERWGLAGAPVVISTRTLDALYDVGTLLAAAPAVLAKFPSTVFLIAGSGPQAETLREQARALGVAGQVRFPGRYTEDELCRYLSCVTVYVSTALSDGGLAASTAEAMASGVPAVISDVADNRLWVEDGVSGYLHPPRDPRALADRILRLLGDPALRRACGEGARRTIVTRNDRTTEMGRMENLYAELVRSRSGGSPRPPSIASPDPEPGRSGMNGGHRPAEGGS